uniref:Cyanobacterial aminoacyl-tRNA synthetase CAAD domain-containing protein n=1 Tax=Kalanchoe fedtschenkoi TaxID=63787 RepID=A0A7N0T3C8_KALFE
MNTISAAATPCFAPLPALRPCISAPLFPNSSSLPSRSVDFAPLRLSSGPNRLSSFQVQASSSEESPNLEVGELFSDLKAKWDALENKPTVLLYGGGAVVAVWLSSVIIGAINSVPLLPSILELVGIGYSGWFVYRYLLFESSRKELATDIDSLKKTISSAIE